MPPLHTKAKNLLLQLKSLQECDPTNTIGAFTILNEVLRDAESLANDASDPRHLSVRLKEHLVDVSLRSKIAMERAQKALENSQRLLGHYNSSNERA